MLIPLVCLAGTVLIETSDHKPLAYKISGAMDGVDIDRLDAAVRALCHGWINSHESTTAAENQTRQGQGPDEPRRPRFIPDPKGCDNRHSNLAEVCAEIVIKFQSKLTVRAHRLEPITALMLECSTLPIGSQQVRLNVDPLYLPTTSEDVTPTGRSETSRTNSCHSINSSSNLFRLLDPGRYQVYRQPMNRLADTQADLVIYLQESPCPSWFGSGTPPSGQPPC